MENFLEHVEDLLQAKSLNELKAFVLKRSFHGTLRLKAKFGQRWLSRILKELEFKPSQT